MTPLVFAICRNMRLSREESFDVFGQVSYLLLKNLENLRSSGKLMTYVAAITRHEVLALNRKAKRIRETQDPILGMLYDRSPDSPEDIFKTTQKSEVLMEAIVLLPERDYELLRALFFDASEPDYEEISKRLGMPVSSIGPTRARCLQKLQRILKRKRFRL